MQQEVTHMMKQGRGCIINVSSMASMAAERQAPMAYCVAKAALNHMTSFAASDYARYGIRVNAILPGTTSTPMLHNFFKDRKSTRLNSSHSFASRMTSFA